MQSNHLLYLLYGKKTAYLHEAKFSILSALRHQADRESFSITVFTDHPEAFEDWPVRTVFLDEATLAQWMGPAGYVHRRKAMAIRQGMELAEKTIFVDTDTIFVKDPAILFDRVSDEHFLMDQFEFCWQHASQRDDYTGLVAELAANKRSPSPSLRLYNSGICGMTRHHTGLLDEAITLIDQWSHLHTQLHTMEQIAVSFMLGDKQVVEARDCVHHYYSQKSYYHAMVGLFFQRFDEQFSRALVEVSRGVPSHIPPPNLTHRVGNRFRLMGLSSELRKVGRYYLLGRKPSTCVYLDATRYVFWDKALEALKTISTPQKRDEANKLWAQDRDFHAFAERRSRAVN
ncbi:hypothetical protein LOY42_18730 [Pseudomonas sp. B21-023]|uniref:hypothetical protein n=1 Tax=unclassified Pseudomonas TaxID=196821 RepID=UPI00215E7937|nr:MULTISPECIES: hypothetical protein [unclassified Pseudomonas]UVL17933.1 hypothetical protein LOY44_18280 [Pseudomonas sp. B21-044]UVM15297.1 hypothetical protein LOY42_18730 [Pseudomonas sp. B21-023]